MGWMYLATFLGLPVCDSISNSMLVLLKGFAGYGVFEGEVLMGRKGRDGYLN